ncbi:hypothetical protein PRUPE_3G180300 [Prunus persica]|uniref:Uncharacterized protein n=1 Tax=Prunus persica TaxID=3760 RepID=A0A251Q1T3_PRUPE|nr:hypothetical protein PRUPE_3G180300 [Prunus persica]
MTKILQTIQIQSQIIQSNQKQQSKAEIILQYLSPNESKQKAQKLTFSRHTSVVVGADFTLGVGICKGRYGIRIWEREEQKEEMARSMENR